MSHGRGRCVLLVVRMQRKDTVHRTAQDRIDVIFLGRNRKAHVQEIGRIIQIVAWIHKRLANRVFIGPGRNGWHLRDQSMGRDLALTWIRHIGAVVLEGRHRPRDTGHDRHWVRVTTETAEEVHHLLVQHGVACDGAFEFLKLGRRGQLTVKQQVADL